MDRPRNFLDFSSFRWDTVNRALYCNGEQVQLRPKAQETMAVFLQHAGELMSKDRLKAAIWGEGKSVPDNSVDQQIAEIRRILGDSITEPRFIETVPKQGYRFIAKTTVCIPAGPLPVGPVWLPMKRVLTGLVRDGDSRLMWTLVGIVVVLAVATTLYLLSRRSRTLTEKDTIVLADFDNSTGDPVFDGTLRQGLSSQLDQSPFLNLLSDDRVAEALALMGRPKNAHLTGPIAREICQRTASSISIQGSISNLGSQYVLWLRAVDCPSGEFLAQVQVTAVSKMTVLSALDRAATKIREKLGESKTSMQTFDVPLERVTTPLLEALHSYSLGSQTLILRNDSTAAIGFFLRAIALDPSFAMAYAKLASSYSNAGEASHSAESIRQAYELRGRVSEREKFYIASHFEHLATGNLEAARRTYEVWSQTYPRDADPLGDLDTVYYALGEYEKALAAAQRSLNLRPSSGLDYGNVVFAYLNVNRLAEAVAAARESETRHIDSSFTHEPLYLVAFLQHDSLEMQRQVAASRGKPGVEDVMLYYESDTAAYAGLLEDARQLTRSAMAHAQRANENETAAQYGAEASLREALVGNFELSKSLARSALDLSKGRDVEAIAAIALALAGDSVHVRPLTDDLSNRFPDDTLVRFNYLPTINAAVALGSGKAGMAIKAIEMLAKSASIDMGSPAQPTDMAAYPVYLRGVAYLAARQGVNAAKEFQRILDHPGVVLNEPIGALAHLGRGRAYSIVGDTVGARAAYQQFLALWKNADAATPIYKQAIKEFTSLPNSIRSREPVLPALR